MSSSPELAINETRYEWCVKAFSLLRHRLGMNLKVHDAAGRIESGQIFLFNHFTRFETIIPQYVIHQATGAFCRCVAAGELFRGNDGFSRFLWSVGAVPSDHPGLLPFLAAEILRGRKIILFPEGGMIKDRRVIDENGEYGVYSPSAQAVRKHHQGAAATALMLEIFKKRILSVHEAGDTARLGRWVEALGLESMDKMIDVARQETLIVPANITFYPLHTADNILRKSAELFGHELSDRAREELLIEGNLLLKRTDMDIRFGEPIRPQVAWNFVERILLRRMFEQIDSLNDLFAMKDTSPRWGERMVATAMRRETQRLRDAGMAEMYRRVTVNLNHLASRLILALFDKGTVEISRGDFFRLLYRAFKHAQSAPDIHFHRSLAKPESYDGLHDGTTTLLDHFFGTASASGLIEVEHDAFKFLPKVRETRAFHQARLENVVQVYANEIAPIAGACEAVERALRDDAKDNHALAYHLIDDEVRAYGWCKEAYSHSKHAAINDQESATADATPYLLVPDRPKDLGVVLIHGLLASPAELRAFGDKLLREGYPVIGVRLKGHGTSPWDLHDRSWRDWLSSVRRGYEIMSLLAPRIAMVGFSTGAALALHLAAENPGGLAGVAAVSAPVKFRNKTLVFAPLVHGLNKLTEWASDHEGIMPFRLNETEHPDINYRNVPIHALSELKHLCDELPDRLADVACPVAVLQAAQDHVVDPASAEIIFSRLGSASKSLHMIASERHGIFNEDIGDTHSLVLSFLQSRALATPYSRPLPKPTAAPETTPLAVAADGSAALSAIDPAAVPRAVRAWISRIRPK